MTEKNAILSIAGFDPTGGAGVLTDAAVFRTLDFHPLTVLTSVAAQGASGVHDVHPLPEALIRRELEIISQEFAPSACKIGMLYSEGAVQATSDFLDRRELPTVLDPVLKASGGGALITSAALNALEEKLIPRCKLITPNIDEASHFLGRAIKDGDEAVRAASDLSKRWNCAVLLKGGHLTDDPFDVFAFKGSCTNYSHPRLHKGTTARGTGCALSAAVAAGLARGDDLQAAVEFGINFVQEAMQTAYRAGRRTNIQFLELITEPPSGQNPHSR